MRPLRSVLFLAPTVAALAGVGCMLPKCDRLCQRQADCVEETIADNGASWEEWTGFADRDAYVQACFEVFEVSRDNGARRGELQRTCKAELDRDSCDGG